MLKFSITGKQKILNAILSCNSIRKLRQVRGIRHEIDLKGVPFDKMHCCFQDLSFIKTQYNNNYVLDHFIKQNKSYISQQYI